LDLGEILETKSLREIVDSSAHDLNSNRSFEK